MASAPRRPASSPSTARQSEAPSGTASSESSPLRNSRFSAATSLPNSSAAATRACGSAWRRCSTRDQVRSSTTMPASWRLGSREQARRSFCTAASASSRSGSVTIRRPQASTSAPCTPTYASRCRRRRRCSVSTFRAESTAPRVFGAAQSRISAAREAGLVLRWPCEARWDKAVSNEKNPYRASASAMRSRRLSASNHSGRTAPVRPSSEFRTRPPRPAPPPQTKLCMGGRRWEPDRGPAPARACTKAHSAPRLVAQRVAARLQYGRNDRLPDLRAVHGRVPMETPQLLELRVHFLGGHGRAERGARAIEGALAALHAEEAAERVAQLGATRGDQGPAEDRVHRVHLDGTVGQRRQHFLALLERRTEGRRSTSARKCWRRWP